MLTSFSVVGIFSSFWTREAAAASLSTLNSRLIGTKPSLRLNNIGLASLPEKNSSQVKAG